MSFVANILLILLSLLFSVKACHSLPAAHIPEEIKRNQTNPTAGSYPGAETVRNTADVKSIQVKNEESKYFTGSKESKDGNIEENNQAEMKYKSVKGWRKLRAVVSDEMKANSKTVSSHGRHGRHKREKNSRFDVDYDPPRMHPPSHN